ncbi:MAG: hypothetical protein VYB09_06985 [Planctomycetota bacterium]|nr:hypothetical protein [Planctomycetota bacterium]
MYRKFFTFMLLGVATVMMGCSNETEENASGDAVVPANQVKLEVTGMT